MRERDPGIRVGPLEPNEVAEAKQEQIPAEVFEVFNTLITENFSSGQAVVKQKDVVALMKEVGIDTAEAFKRGWLDIEEIYMKAGWDVEYDKPGYNETYDAYFIFSV